MKVWANDEQKQKQNRKKVPGLSGWGSADARTRNPGTRGKGCRFLEVWHPQEARQRTGFGHCHAMMEREAAARRKQKGVAGEGGTAGATGAVPASPFPEVEVDNKGSEGQPPPEAVELAGSRRPCRPSERDRGTI